mmetsp:Transcript_15946/g.23326  ORF Transcript_15946/g.23326 Transcript_15946/m.23326 type:complete len:197 (+) Transcript_15946:131-721(+)
MSVCCLFGVCIPYTAILPMLVILLQYIARPLAKIGLLPEPIAKYLGVYTSDSASAAATAAVKASNACTNGDTKCCAKSAAGDETDTTTMHEIKNSEQLHNLLQNNTTVFVKFTAEWCKPCKKIQPHFHKIAQTCNRNKTKTAFATVDVDGLEDIVAEYKVVAMPTFIAIRNGSKVSSMSGANEDNLDSFVKKVLEA